MKWILVAGSLALITNRAAAQTNSVPCPPASDTTRAAIRVEASVRAETLRLNAPSSGARAAVSPCNTPGAVRVERENLPNPAQPGVTYRYVSVRVLITGDPVLACRLGAALAADSAGVAAAVCPPARP
jgi:hypothetical protein